MKNNHASPKTRRANGSRMRQNQTQERELLSALKAFKNGDFTARLPEDWSGISGQIAETFNKVIETNQRLAKELERITRSVGKEGRITERASLGNLSNCWAEAIGSVNDLIGNL
ncbi:MAG: hypothetical protein DMF04_11540, partial [Verrucomicrobia bacterium]